MGNQVFTALNLAISIVIALLTLILGFQITTERRVTKIESKVDILLECFSEKIKQILKS